METTSFSPSMKADLDTIPDELACQVISNITNLEDINTLIRSSSRYKYIVPGCITEINTNKLQILNIQDIATFKNLIKTGNNIALRIPNSIEELKQSINILKSMVHLKEVNFYVQDVLISFKEFSQYITIILRSFPSIHDKIIRIAVLLLGKYRGIIIDHNKLGLINVVKDSTERWPEYTIGDEAQIIDTIIGIYPDIQWVDLFNPDHNSFLSDYARDKFKEDNYIKSSINEEGLFLVKPTVMEWIREMDLGLLYPHELPGPENPPLKSAFPYFLRTGIGEMYEVYSILKIYFYQKGWIPSERWGNLSYP